MYPKRHSFVKTIQYFLSAILLLFVVAVIGLQITHNRQEFELEVEKSRSEILAINRNQIQRGAERVARAIDYRRIVYEQDARDTMRQRIIEAHALVEDIYRQNIQSQSRPEVQQMIIDALRPIRFDNGRGYFFIFNFNGLEILNADKPEQEGTNMLSVVDGRGNYVVRDMINLANTRGEGSYGYYWSKPGDTGTNHKKVSYIKAFEPFQWVIGTGRYTEDLDQQLQQEISAAVRDYRFGKDNNGYVFVLELADLQGGEDFALVFANPNTPEIVGSSLSENTEDANGKKFLQEMMVGIREKGECFVDYYYPKPGSPEPRPKTAFFKLTEDGRFIVAAGIYLDDLEANLQFIKDKFNRQMRFGLAKTVLAAIGLFLAFGAFFHFSIRRLLGDFSQLSAQIQHATDDEEVIDRRKIRFRELYDLAGSANIMLQDKISAQKELLDERNQLAVTLRSIADAVIAVDGDGCITLMNHVAEDICGYSEEDSLGKPISEVFKLFRGHGMDQMDGPVNKALKSGLTVTSGKPALLRSKKGTHYSVETSAAPIRTSRGNNQGAVLVFRDVTQALRKEQEIFRSRKLESVGILAGGLAHDFNNLLTSVFGNIQMIRLQLPGDHPSVEHLDHAEQSMESATNLTKQLLTFAKGGDPVKTTLSIGEAIAETARFSLRGSNVKLHLDIDPNLSLVEADKGQLNQVVSNLVINAQQAMPEGGTVAVSARNLCGAVVISIADEGVGIAERHLAKIFDPYFTTKNQGSGLGLATSHSIIEKHNGSISVESTLDEGTTFTISLPASTETIAPAEKPAPGQGQAEEMIQADILVLDDDKSVRRILGKTLSFLGHTMSFAATGDEALEMYRARFAGGSAFDLVITDLTIPGGMGGQKTAEEILKIHPQAKLIVASGYATDPVIAHYEDYGFMGRIVKPYYLKDLKKVVSDVLGA